MEEILMKIWLNNAVRRAVWLGLDRELSREFKKWDGYPRNPYGDNCMREDCNRLYWQDQAWAFRRQHTWNGEKNTVFTKFYGFRWSDIF
jgi:hypothetical protein